MLSIKTNLSNLRAQYNLKTNTTQLNQAVERLSSGYKLNHASDNAANYSISTNMSTKLGAYQVAEENVNMALEMTNTALESLSVMQNLTNRLRTLSMQAQNSTNSSFDSIYTEAVSLINDIYRTKNSASYNGISLFGGIEDTSNFTLPDGTTQSGGKFIEKVVRRDTTQMQTVASLDENATTTGGTYSVSSVEELEKAFTMISNGNLKSAEIVLADNLDYSEFAGTHKTARVNFDGNGFVISNYSSTGASFFVGNGTVVKNLGLEDVNISGNNDGACSFGNSNIKLTNCFVTGVINGRNIVGGLCSQATGAILKSCYADVTVSGGHSIGGLVGSVDANAGFRIENCYVMGSISGANIGGLVGGLFVRGDMTSYIINSCSTADLNGGSPGGLVGYMSAAGHLYIENCYATGAITANTTTMGGLIGNVSGTNLHLTNCYYNSESTGQCDTGKGVGVTSRELNRMVAQGILPDFGLDLPLPDIFDTNVDYLFCPSSVNFQVGSTDENSAGINIDLVYTVEGLRELCYLGLDNEKSLEKIDLMSNSIASKSSELGALQNRLYSVLEEIGVKYDNLISSRSTIRDADVADMSAGYIKQQILQNAGATLMSTSQNVNANLVLGLLQGLNG